MSKSSGILKAIGYSFGASIAASLSALLIGTCVFGFQLAQWAEWESGLVGVVGTTGRVVLVVEGAVEIGDGRLTRSLARGAAVFGYPGETLTVSGDGTVVVAAPGI